MSYLKKDAVLAAIKSRDLEHDGEKYTIFEAYLGTDPYSKKPVRMSARNVEKLRKKVTAFFNYANADRRAAVTAKPVDDKGVLRSGKGGEKLPLELSEGDGFYVMLPNAAGELELKKTDDAARLADLRKNFKIDPKEDLGDAYDAASAIVTDDDGHRWRFPYANEAMRGAYARDGRLCRECCTERDLLNLAGILYELPAENAGGFSKVRSIATTGVSAYDYCTWRGLFVISGLRPAQEGLGKVITSDDGKASVWVGVADDLWKFGKAVGVGGPWKDTAVKAGVPSDPYLMTGFDRKSVTVSADRDVSVSFEFDLTGTGVWVKSPVSHAGSAGLAVPLKAGRPVTIDMGDIRAYWVRAVADKDCTATVQFKYE